MTILRLCVSVPANGDNAALDSAAVQTVTIPISATLAQLNLRLYPVSTDISLTQQPQMPTSGDVQYVSITPSDTPLTSTKLVWMLSNAQAWQRHRLDLTPFAGQTIGVRVGVINDGQHGSTVLYVDNASLITLGAIGHKVYLSVLLKN